MWIDTGDLIGTEVIVPKNIKIVVSIGLSENEGILHLRKHFWRFEKW
jgi:hypothetical protein